MLKKVHPPGNFNSLSAMTLNFVVDDKQQAKTNEKITSTNAGAPDPGLQIS